MVDDYIVEIVSTYKVYAKPINELNRKVKVSFLTNLKPNKMEFKCALKRGNLFSVFKEGFRSIKILILKKKLMVDFIKNCDADVIISTRDIHNSWLGKYGSSNALKIGWEHNHHHGDSKYVKRIVKSCSNLDYFVVVSQELCDFYKPLVKPTCVYIPNLIEKSDAVSDLKSSNIVSVGRLSPEKGFIDLIEVFSLVHEKYPSWKLNIVGDGEEKKKILSHIKKYNLDDSVIMHGFLDKNGVSKVLSNSSIYVMTSYTESFGIVLLEAFSHGVPCVAFDSAEGANEIITNNWDGYLVSNRDFVEMSRVIGKLIDCPGRREAMGVNGLDKIKKYSLSRVKSEWVDIIK